MQFPIDIHIIICSRQAAICTFARWREIIKVSKIEIIFLNLWIDKFDDFYLTKKKVDFKLD